MEVIIVEGWIRTNEENEAVRSLEMTYELLQKTSNNPYYWKWVVVCLHNSLQGFMVLALRSTDGFRILKKSSREGLSKYFKGELPEPPKKIEIESFLDLYKKIKKPKEMRIYHNSQAFAPTPSGDSNIRYLNELRNEFIHFKPQGWSISTDIFMGVLRESLNVIKFLVFESGNIYWSDNGLSARTRELINRLDSFSLEFQQLKVSTLEDA
jgi:hypothetical protein